MLLINVGIAVKNVFLVRRNLFGKQNRTVIAKKFIQVLVEVKLLGIFILLKVIKL